MRECWSSGALELSDKSSLSHNVRTSVRPYSGTRVGFSLIELVISLGILSFGLVGAMRIFPLGLQASRRTEMISRATIIASRTLETVKLTPIEDLVVGTTQDQVEVFSVVTEISQLQMDVLVEPERLRKVVVTVSWQQNERSRDLSFVTYIWGKIES